KAEQQAGLHEVMQAAQDWFRANLDTPDGARAREYLASRRLDGHTLDRFGFGLAPNSRTALKAAPGQFPEPMLIDAGLPTAAAGPMATRSIASASASRRAAAPH